MKGLDPLFCDLCGEPAEDNREAYEASGMNICTHCLEAMLETTVNPGTTLELVGAGRCW